MTTITQWVAAYLLIGVGYAFASLCLMGRGEWHDWRSLTKRAVWRSILLWPAEALDALADRFGRWVTVYGREAHWSGPHIIDGEWSVESRFWTRWGASRYARWPHVSVMRWRDWKAIPDG
jgi:hypothetical protein